LGEDVYDSNGKSIPSKINAIIFDEKNRETRVLYEAIFLNLVPKKILKAIHRMKPNSVLILDFFMIFSYLQSIAKNIDYFVMVTCSEETQAR
jgi:dephospho-CoA kinase